LILQRLQDKVLRTTGNFPKVTPVRNLRMNFKVPYIYDYTPKLCRQQAEVIKNHKNKHFHILQNGVAQPEIRKFPTSWRSSLRPFK
jgi:hypothetical protein